MDLLDLQRHWDAFGKRDPFWAILTDPSKRGNRWTPEAFFETGSVEVAELLEHVHRLDVPRHWRRALDFGCGAGRLTQALGDRFDSVLGVDVAPSMIDLARAHNRHGARCTYEVNDRPDLSRWPDGAFDLIYTSRVLQHIEPRYSVAYLREFLRLLAPGGILSFDLPSAAGDAAALADGSVPVSAMRADLSVVPEGTLVSPPGEALRYQITVTNLSGVSWRDAAGRELNVGNHWLDAAGTMVQQDDQRVKLPTPLDPGASARVEMEVLAPAGAGVYRLQFDVVQEGVAWFASCGSAPAETMLRVDAEYAHPPDASVAPPASTAPDEVSGSDDLEPVMEMHAVPREDVESILEAAGARLLDVRRTHHCGPLWLAFRYDVTR
jgi:SAM-dependent methyltransferase